jgi:hypothetical protein
VVFGVPGPSSGSGVLGGPMSANAELAIGGKTAGTKLFGSPGEDEASPLGLSKNANVHDVSSNQCLLDETLLSSHTSSSC